jgi:hypothetical protein
MEREKVVCLSCDSISGRKIIGGKKPDKRFRAKVTSLGYNFYST